MGVIERKEVGIAWRKQMCELLGNAIERMKRGLLKIDVRVCLLFLHLGRPPKEEEGVDFKHLMNELRRLPLLYE